jgi:hypothetical protein
MEIHDQALRKLLTKIDQIVKEDKQAKKKGNLEIVKED